MCGKHLDRLLPVREGFKPEKTAVPSVREFFQMFTHKNGQHVDGMIGDEYCEKKSFDQGMS